jgi:hypothetical protein
MYYISCFIYSYRFLFYHEMCRVLRRILELKRNEVTEGMRKLHNEEE